MIGNTATIEVKGGSLELRFTNYALYLLDKELGESCFMVMADQKRVASLEFLVAAIRLE